MVMVMDMFLIFSTVLARLSTFDLMVDDTVDGKDNLEELAA